jgi:hypothetical protein
VLLLQPPQHRCHCCHGQHHCCHAGPVLLSFQSAGTVKHLLTTPLLLLLLLILLLLLVA